MKSKTVILMVVAVACGLVASYLTSRMLAQQNVTQEKVKILVAKGKIAYGTLLKEPRELFTEKEFTKGTEPRGAIADYELLKEKRVNKPIGPEVHVTEDDLIKGTEQGGLPVVIPSGYRAVSIKVAPDTNVGGFVLPNTRVDVVSTIRGTDAVARTILQDVLVLAVDQLHNKQDDGKAAVAAQTVTLQCKLEDAEKLAMAGSLGELRLVLRGIGDNEKVHTKGVKPGDVIKGVASAGGEEKPGEEGGTGGGPPVSPTIPDAPEKKAEPVPEKKPEPVVVVKPRKKHTMTVINGPSVARAVFDEDEEGGVRAKIEKKDSPETAPKPAPKPTEEAPAAVEGDGAARTPEADPGKAPEKK